MKSKSLFSSMKIQEKPEGKNTIDCYLICFLVPEISAFEEASKMAPKMVRLTVIETLAERGQNF